MEKFEELHYKGSLKEDIDEINRNIDEIDSLRRFNIPNTLNNGLRLVVADCDECLVNITLKWVYGLKQMKIIDERLDDATVFNRKSYYIESLINFDLVKKYLLKDQYKNMTANDFAMSIYKMPDFYDDLDLSSLGKCLKVFLNHGLIKLAIISHTVKENRKSKENFLKKHFPEADTFLIEPGKRKSDIINKYDLNNYSTFIDDSLKNIYDVILNTQSIGKEFLLPKYGYNDIWFCEGLTKEELDKKQPTKIDAEMFEVISELGCKIAYYDPLN